MKPTLTVFVTYSWDSQDHKEWVTSFVNLLRAKGINATSDVFQTQTSTINLNHMMVKNIKNSDYIIIISTSNYAQRANDIKGGVGFETNMLMSVIQENMQKVILILKDKSNDAIPLYLTGVNYIDFSEDSDFSIKFEELLHRILGVPLIEVEPLGELPNLTPQKTKSLIPELQEDLLSKLIPNLKKHTDIDENKFLNANFIELKQGFIALLNNTKEKNDNFDFEYEDLTTKKSIYKLYINGDQVYSFKLWLANSFGFGGPETINFAHSRYVSESDTSMNEIIGCEVDGNNSLRLKMSMNMSVDNANTPIKVLTALWKSIVIYIK